MKRFDAIRLASVLGAAAAALAACDQDDCARPGGWTDGNAKGTPRCDTSHAGGGRLWWGGGHATGRDSPAVTRGGFGATASHFFSGVFRGTFGG